MGTLNGEPTGSALRPKVSSRQLQRAEHSLRATLHS
jgi:hypothetical protein